MRRLLPIAGLLFLSGCATLAHGRFQHVDISSEPSGALVYRGNMLLGVTPLRPKFSRRESRLVLRFEKTGYQSVTVPLERGKSAWLAADLAMGPMQMANQGIASDAERAAMVIIAPSILLGVDLATGAAFALPSRVSVVLSPLVPGLKTRPLG
jgi:hypothetical protein